jgi:dGTPase
LRAYFEELEDRLLKPYAAKCRVSKGRKFPEEQSDTRTLFQKDRDRIIHSKSFRRLKHKTQVFMSTSSDHYRSRLTHTIEVSHLSRHLARLLQVNEDLTECIALAHDLGHSPFGHSGEKELNQLLKAYGGFEHNLHSLKIVESLEKKYPYFDGLNLTFEVLEGLKKHQAPWSLSKKASQNPAFITIEAQIANIADEIAYNNHDLDDGLASGLLQYDELTQHISLWNEAHKAITNKYSNLAQHQRIHLINSYLISAQVNNVFQHSTTLLNSLQLKDIEALQQVTTPVLCFDAEMNEKNKELRHYLASNLYQHPSIKKSNEYGRAIIRELFIYFFQNPQKMPSSFTNEICDTYTLEQVVGDYIANMTDSYAVKCINSIS